VSGAEALGWAATVVFTASYVCRGASAMLRVQLVGALLWMAYGMVLQATPVVAANAIVVAAAAVAVWRQRATPQQLTGGLDGRG
jgi:hypothetical protein